MHCTFATNGLITDIEEAIEDWLLYDQTMAELFIWTDYYFAGRIMNRFTSDQYAHRYPVLPLFKVRLPTSFSSP
jgi:hypothetical protein